MTDFECGDNSNDVVLLKNQLAVARSEINNLRQQLKALKHTYRKDCDEIRQQLENWRCMECRNRQLNAPEGPHIDLSLQYIGTIHTHFPEKRGTPRQPGICSEMIAKLTLSNSIFTNPEHALEGLQEYSHMWILFHFHKNDATHTRAKVAPPRLNGLRTGVFATRAPHRPCPIGLSLVKIDRIMENTIYFSGVDMVDQTPVLDIKPYIPQYDNPSVSLPFDDSVGNISTISDSAQDTDLMNVSSINSSVLDNSRVMDGEENGAQAAAGASNANANDAFYESRSVSRIGEREAPDGEEEEAPRQSNSTVQDTPQRQIRVPTWIDQPPVSTLTVHFTQRALLQLQQLGSEGEQKKIIITNVLQEDPRSVYLRERVENTNYVFRIAELYVSCMFDDAARTVTVFQIFQDRVVQDE